MNKARIVLRRSPRLARQNAACDDSPRGMMSRHAPVDLFVDMDQRRAK
ncbi:MAG: hypothetical protein Q8O52_18010 [Sulfuritalea sp.]|nr:hypothetical protein [Sulfuritalea sp.]